MLNVGDVVNIGREGLCVIVRVSDCGAKAVPAQGRLSDPAATFSAVERGHHISAGSMLEIRQTISLSRITDRASTAYDRMIKEREFVFVPVPGLNPPMKRRRPPRPDVIADVEGDVIDAETVMHDLLLAASKFDHLVIATAHAAAPEPADPTAAPAPDGQGQGPSELASDEAALGLGEFAPSSPANHDSPPPAQ